MNCVAAVIVAAGSSSRLGQPKQLLVFDGEPLLERTIRVASASGAAPVFVVLGAHRESIQNRVNFAGVRIVINEQWDEGLGSSVRAGVRAVDSEAPNPTGVLLMTCDQPRVSAEHLRRMVDAASRAREAAVVSAYAGARGTPAIFPSTAFADLCRLRGDRGARSLLLNPLWPVIEIELEGGEIDIDRPEDLNHLR